MFDFAFGWKSAFLRFGVSERAATRDAGRAEHGAR